MKKQRKKVYRRKNTKKINKKNKSFLILLPIIFIFVLLGCYFYKKANTISLPLQYSSITPVIDVAKWEGTIDWKKVKRGNIQHAVLKIGSGDYNGEGFNEDPLFKKNYKNAVNNRIHCGIYFFSYAVTPEEAKREAIYCLELLDKYDIQPSDLFFPVAFDLEYDKALQTGKRNCTEMTVAFCETIKEAGYDVMVYSSASYLENKLIYEEIKDYKLWVAHYESDGPAFGKPYVMWQYSEDGNVNGVKDLCDMNYWYSNYIEVERLEAVVDTLTLSEGDTHQLDVIIRPYNATNKKLTYKSSNSDIVTVTDLQKGTLKASGKGTAWITIETPSGVKERIRVKVK